ncbi:MAG: nickel-dependent malate racemase, LarAH5 family [Anaerolineaceae bacterium]
MMKKTCTIPYGSDEISFQFPEKTPNYDVFYPPEPSHKPLTNTDVYAILSKNTVSIPSKSSVAIAINDKTRPVRYDILLTPLLQYLAELGIHEEAITLFISTGTHTPISAKEFAEFIPAEIASRYRIVCHDCDDASQLIDLGITKTGTPVLINRLFYEADTKITLGTIEPHHFMGFSGGAKTAGIGLAGRSTIEANHHLLLQPNTVTGEYERNPMRQDLEEIGDHIKITACLNAVMSYKKDVLQVLWDSPRAVMQKGILESKQLTQVAIPPTYDLVIASAGGFPKDINLYQAQKALTHACMLCKTGGSIILAAECREGHGNQKYADFMYGKTSFQQVLDEFGKVPFRIGPHKAYLIARQGLKYNIYLKSSMPDDAVRNLLLTPIHTIEEMLSRIDLFGMRIAVLPYATTTVPC